MLVKIWLWLFVLIPISIFFVILQPWTVLGEILIFGFIIYKLRSDEKKNTSQVTQQSEKLSHAPQIIEPRPNNGTRPVGDGTQQQSKSEYVRRCTNCQQPLTEQSGKVVHAYSKLSSCDDHAQKMGLPAPNR